MLIIDGAIVQQGVRDPAIGLYGQGIERASVTANQCTVPMQGGLVNITPPSSYKVQMNKATLSVHWDKCSVIDVMGIMSNALIQTILLLEFDCEFMDIHPYGSSYTDNIPWLAIWDNQFFSNTRFDVRDVPKLIPKTIREVFAFRESFALRGWLTRSFIRVIQVIDYDLIGANNIIKGTDTLVIDYTNNITTGRPIAVPKTDRDLLFGNQLQLKRDLTDGNFWALLNGRFADDVLIADIVVCETLTYDNDQHTTLVSVSGHPNLLIEACTRPNTPSIIIMFTRYVIYDAKYIGGVYNVAQEDKKDYIFDSPTPTISQLLIDAAVRNRHLTRKELMPNIMLDVIDDTEITYYITKPHVESCDTFSFKWCDFSSWFNPAMIRRRELIAKLEGLVKIDLNAAPIEQLEKLAAIF